MTQKNVITTNNSKPRQPKSQYLKPQFKVLHTAAHTLAKDCYNSQETGNDHAGPS
jgi:hypothetical protein